MPSLNFQTTQQVELTQKQSLTLTPKLQQAIKILNMNSQELDLEIKTILSHNVMLKLDDGVSYEQLRLDEEIEDEDFEEKEMLDINDLSEELPYDASWEDHYSTDWKDATGYQEEATNLEEIYAQEKSLEDFLIEQLNHMNLDNGIKNAAIALIYHIDNDGYLRESPNALAKEYGLTLDVVKKAVKAIKNCQPIGVGAKDLEECLNIQISYLPKNTPYLKELKKIMLNHFQYLAKKPEVICQHLEISRETYDKTIKLLRSLNPRPAKSFAPINPQSFIHPDIIVKEKNGMSFIEVGENLRPKIEIDTSYEPLIKELERKIKQKGEKNEKDKHDKLVLQTQLEEARWLINAIDKRADTVKRVAAVIVALQQDFFREGEIAMQPLTRHKVAKMLDIHESTVSRAVNGKYLICKRGIYELRYFFSTSLEPTEEGEELQSSTAAKAVIAELIKNENPKKPLSDNSLSKLLLKEGYQIARRTIAKYREELGIAASSLRKKIG